MNKLYMFGIPVGNKIGSFETLINQETYNELNEKYNFERFSNLKIWNSDLHNFKLLKRDYPLIIDESTKEPISFTDFLSSSYEKKEDGTERFFDPTGPKFEDLMSNQLDSLIEELFNNHTKK